MSRMTHPASVAVARAKTATSLPLDGRSGRPMVGTTHWKTMVKTNTVRGMAGREFDEAAKWTEVL